MRKNDQQTWPEAFVSNAESSSSVSRAVREGRLRKLASRLYSRNMTDSPEAIVQRNLWTIVAGYFPGALVADRTALENNPATDGSVCLITEHGTEIKLPGIILRPRRGAAPHASDRPFIGGLFLSSTARAYLENMRPSRGRGTRLPRTLTRLELEDKLEAFLRRSGTAGFLRLRDEIRTLAPALNLVEESKPLDDMMGAFLGTREAELASEGGRARQAGLPFDPDRMELFATFHRVLREHFPAPVLVAKKSPESLATLAFFEAYFSNFIEGTEFGVREAVDIVFNGIIPSERSPDAHDVLGTWKLVSDGEEMRRLPRNAREFLDILRQRHATVMEGRPDKGRGRFKSGSNRVGMSIFVAPDLVEGTLEKGFALSQSLESALQRAIFMMFLIAEVHPFADGNGRLARIMMNAELIAAGEQRIIIPTVFRNNYLASLRSLTQNREGIPLIRTLDYAQRWTHAVDWGSLDQTAQILEACNAFQDPNQADLEGIRLIMPHG